MENTLNKHQIGFIGGGNMASAIAGGLLQAGMSAAQITISDIDEAKLKREFGKSGMQLTTDNIALVEGCDVAVLAVKPQDMKAAVEPLSSVITVKQPLLISIAAGISIELLTGWSYTDAAVVRVMPNTPSLVNAGASGLFANAAVSDAQKSLSESIMQAVGVTTWVEEESLIDSVTGVSGSGPAYFFYLIEALEHAAIEQGLSAEQARLLSRETALGAAKLAASSDSSVQFLRECVTSKGGTTAAGINAMQQGKLAETVHAAVDKATRRAEELAQMAAQD